MPKYKIAEALGRAIGRDNPRELKPPTHVEKWALDVYNDKGTSDPVINSFAEGLDEGERIGTASRGGDKIEDALTDANLEDDWNRGFEDALTKRGAKTLVQLRSGKPAATFAESKASADAFKQRLREVMVDQLKSKQISPADALSILNGDKW